MKVRHDDDELRQMEADPEYSGRRFDRSVVRGFRKVMNLIRSVGHETELTNFRGANFKRLKGKREHQWSLRLNDQWRLIVEIEEAESGNCIVTKGIEDYH